jgi:CRP-like cAMP-binding protein
MDYSALSNSPLFKGLTPEEIEKTLSHIQFHIKKYRDGSMIAQSGEPVNSLMILIKGIVKGEMVDYSGRVIKIEDIPAPGVLASAFMFGNKNRFPVNVIAISDSELLIIEKSEFLKMMMSENRILANFLDIISNRSQFLSEKIKFLNFKTIKSKLAQYILQRAGMDKTIVIMDMKQNELAEFFGVARQSIARSVHEMEEEGLIHVHGKKFEILNRKGLSDLIMD